MGASGRTCTSQCFGCVWSPVDAEAGTPKRVPTPVCCRVCVGADFYVGHTASAHVVVGMIEHAYRLEARS